MKTTGFIIFFSIFLAVYGLVNYYIFIRGLQAIERDSFLRTAYLVLFPIALYVIIRQLDEADGRATLGEYI